jgi:hypothetical protein
MTEWKDALHAPTLLVFAQQLPSTMLYKVTEPFCAKLMQEETVKQEPV